MCISCNDLQQGYRMVLLCNVITNPPVSPPNPPTFSLFFFSFSSLSSSFIFSSPSNVAVSPSIMMSLPIFSSPSRFPSITGVTGNSTWDFLFFILRFSAIIISEKKVPFLPPLLPNQKIPPPSSSRLRAFSLPLGAFSGSCVVPRSHWPLLNILFFCRFIPFPLFVYRCVGCSVGTFWTLRITNNPCQRPQITA